MDSNQTSQTAASPETKQMELPVSAEHQPYSYKLSDEELIETLNENNGIYSRAARAIEQKYGITITRQSVQERAIRLGRQLINEREELKDYAKDAIFQSVTQNKDMKLKLKTAIFILSKLD